MHAFISATKVTGFLAVIPMILLHVARRDFKKAFLATGACFTSILFIVFLAPDQWHNPAAAAWAVLTYPLHRVAVADVTSFYLWKQYGEHLPWHYFFVMTAITAPIMHLLLSVASPLAWKKQKALLHCLLPMILFWLLLGVAPGVPKHDGTRQFVSFFPFLGLLAWLAALQVKERIPRLHPLLLLLPAAITLGQAHPLEFSYYNSFIGGLHGAADAGMEVNYFLDTLNGATLDWLNGNLPKNATLGILPHWPFVLNAYQSHGLLRPDIKIMPLYKEGEAEFLMLVHRRSYVDETLYVSAPPVFEASRDGVSLLKVVRKPK